jgi:capsular exopolysaccharide synthesis family protein
MTKRSKENAPVSLISLADKRSTVAEQYRAIRSNILFSAVDKELKTIIVTSSGPSEGKSTSAVNLAIVFADTDRRVLLVDADLRKPTIAVSFQQSNSEGLSSLLRDRTANLNKFVVESGIPNLSLLPSGPKPPNPSEMLASNRMEEIMREMKEQYDVILFDMPPVVTVTDAQIMAAKADGTLLVARERKTQKQSFMKAQHLLTLAKANILGVVYNGAKQANEAGYYYYY